MKTQKHKQTAYIKHQNTLTYLHDQTKITNSV